MDRWAWEMGREPTCPADTGAEATAEDYRALAASDGVWWETDLAEDGGYNTQMYRFRISERPQAIDRIEISWEGCGEGQPGYDTALLIWNCSSGAWETLASRDAMGTEGLLGGVVDAWDYLSDEGCLTLVVRARHHALPLRTDYLAVAVSFQERVLPPPEYALPYSAGGIGGIKKVCPSATTTAPRAATSTRSAWRASWWGMSGRASASSSGVGSS